MIVMQDFIDRLHKYMRDNDLSQLQIADMLNSSSSYISLLLSGKRNPSGKFMQRLVDVSGLPSSYWINGTDEEVCTLQNLNKLVDMLIDNGMINENGEMDDNIKNMLDSMLKAEIATKIENKKKNKT